MSKIKLSVEKVRNIRKLYATGNWTHLMISKKYKVSRGHITKVINKMRWDEKNYPELRNGVPQKKESNIH
jgi:Mor family transcriptional regulator